jgi:hypothetical protein
MLSILLSYLVSSHSSFRNTDQKKTEASNREDLKGPLIHDQA